MTVAFHPEAEAEFYEAIDYYEQVEVGLGYDFAIEVYSTIENILTFPDAWTIMENNIRRCLTNRFPFGIVFHHQNDEILILAVMHLNKRPGYWKDRRRVIKGP